MQNCQELHVKVFPARNRVQGGEDSSPFSVSKLPFAAMVVSVDSALLLPVALLNSKYAFAPIRLPFTLLLPPSPNCVISPDPYSTAARPVNPWTKTRLERLEPLPPNPTVNVPLPKHRVKSLQ
jgi:hypothetical protein